MHDHEMMTRPMGDLLGHLFPGILIALWGLWWLVWLARGRQAGVVTHPLEAWIKVLLPVIGILGESRWWRWPLTEGGLSTMQHAVMYAAFTLSGVTDLLALRGRATRAAARLALAGAFLLAGVLFGLHGGHVPLAVLVHRLLAALLVGTAFAAAAEGFSTHPALPWLRAWAATLTGLWLAHVGWMLYVAGYDFADAAVLLRAPFFLSLDALALGVVTLALGSLRRSSP